MDGEMSGRMEGLELKGEEEEEGEAVMFVRTLQELSRTMEAIEEHKVQEDQNETSLTNGKECMCDIFYILYYITTQYSLLSFF